VRVKYFPAQILQKVYLAQKVKFTMLIKEKVAYFESEFCASCASTLLNY